ncbi:unnamed protein product, partial [Vitis vinifera]|uniref:LRR receptor-like serine/threonine-protein kinase n=1 Tax=Vitis vinifera TaxID=29760 RepID=D7STA6_VITVI
MFPSNQKSIKSLFSIEDVKKVGKAISKFFLFNAIPFNAVDSGPYYQSMIDVIAEASPSIKRSCGIWVFVALYGVYVIGLFHAAAAQTSEANATTDPSEDQNPKFVLSFWILIAVTILNSIFQQWGISASNEWNTSGEPCTGAALDSADIKNPGIKCDCSYDNASTCHITQLKVYALDVVGAIPDELWNLTFLTNLNLGQNYLTGSLSASIGNLTSMQYLSLGINALSGELPKELGQLTDLRSIAFGTNNFSGSLPSELGNLVKLEQLISNDIVSSRCDNCNLASN